MKRALVIREKVLGPEHPHTAGSLNNLASLYPSIDRWVVVNEAVKDVPVSTTSHVAGNLRDSIWKQEIGDDFIVKAFQRATQAGIGTRLYNDYNIDLPNAAKTQAVLQLVTQLKAQDLTDLRDADGAPLVDADGHAVVYNDGGLLPPGEWTLYHFVKYAARASAHFNGIGLCKVENLE